MVASLLAGGTLAAAERPNLVIIYADDLGFGDMAAYGRLFGTSSIIPTPHMDALAAQGLLFTQAHSCSGVCTPSRYGILTGRYSWRLAGDGVLPSGIVGLYGNPIIRQGELTLGQFLQNQGYRTAAFGKWHLGAQYYDRNGNPFIGNQTTINNASQIDLHRVEQHAVHRGFHSFFGAADTVNRPPFAYMRDDKVLFNGSVPAPGTHPWTWRTDLAAESPDGVGDTNIAQIQFSPDMIDEAVAFLNSRGTNPQPFFAYVSLYSPHAPHLPTPAFQGSVGYTYGDFVHETDHWIGRVIAAIDSQPSLTNTLIILTSDNGPETHAYTSSRTFGHDSNGPFRGVKRDSWEGGTRVPFVVRWPGRIAPGRITHELVWQGDIFATVAAILGVDLGPNDAPDSESFLNILRNQGKPAARRDSILVASIDNQLALKTLDGWKLIDGTGGGGNATSYDASNKNITNAYGVIGGSPKQLFHLPTDLGENTNLQATATNKLADLQARLALYRSTPTSGVPPPDNDLDGMPNAFENRYGLNPEDPADAVLDADGDGLTNLEEFQNGSNPLLADADGDGLPDAYEVRISHTLPGNADTDGDGLSDGDEVLIHGTDPLLADTDGDGVNDGAELLAFSNPRNPASRPLPPPPVQVILSPVMVQAVGVNGTTNAPQPLGTNGWPEAGALFVRERQTTGTFMEYRTQLFFQFDLSKVTGNLVEARLRVHQKHKLNSNTGSGYSSALELARVLQPWGTNTGKFPLFDQTPVADAFLFGHNQDFGTNATAQGFYSGTPGLPGTNDLGFDPTGRVTAIVGQFLSGSASNHGFRVRMTSRSFAGVAFSSADDTNTVADERLQLLVTTVQPPASLDTDGDRLPDAWEMAQTNSLAALHGDGDADGDGHPNALEIALGSNPFDAQSKPQLQAQVTLGPGAKSVQFAFRRHRQAGFVYELQVSSDLAHWEPWLGYLDPPAVVPESNERESVVFNGRWQSGRALFIRLLIR